MGLLPLQVSEKWREHLEGGYMSQKNITIKEMPKNLRPYEKCLTYGTASLTDEELLAVIIRTGTQGESSFILASRILNLKGNSKGLAGLMHLSLEELTRLKGVGNVKAIQILCICELSKRISMCRSQNRLDFSSPASIADYYMEQCRHFEVEKLIVVYLDTKCHKIHDEIMFQGTVNRSVVSPREIFINALKYNAVNIVILHNHPSGDATPSKDDIYSTKRLIEAGNLVGISLIDHIIIGDRKYISLKEVGII